MILKASTRGNAPALGRHLLNDRDNEHVEVHEVRGFLSDNVRDAMRELDGYAKGVKSRQPIFSVSLSPPQNQQPGIDVYEDAIRQIEEANGLTGQPRIIIFHEKNARRHCHCAWSRINAERMAVKELPFYKNKINQIAKGIYLEQGWELPPGFVDRRERDPRNFDLAEWQRCKRFGRDPRELKMLALESWAVSDNGNTFAQALEQRGLYLARGDRRAFVALTLEGEPFSIPKLLDKRTKEVRARLGEGQALRSVDETRTHIAGLVIPKLKELIGRADAERDQALAPLDQRRAALTSMHRTERQLMDAGIRARAEAENAMRASRLRSGLAGLWDRLRGEYQRIRAQNEGEIWQSLQRDRAQRADLIAAQLRDREALQRDIISARHAHAAKVRELHRDLARQREIQPQAEPGTLRDAFRAARDARERPETVRQPERRNPERERSTERPRDFGYEMD